MVGDLLIKLHPVCVLPAFFILPGTCMREAEPEPSLFFFSEPFFKNDTEKGEEGGKKRQTHPPETTRRELRFCILSPESCSRQVLGSGAAGLVQLCCSPSPVLSCRAFAGAHQDAPTCCCCCCWCSASARETSAAPPPAPPPLSALPNPPPGTPPSPPPALWGSIPGRPAGEMQPCGFNGAALSAFSLLRSPASTAASPASTGASPGLFGGVLGVSELGPPLPAASPSVPLARPRGARSRARGRYRLPTASRSPTGDAQRSLCSPYPSTSCVFIFLFLFLFLFGGSNAACVSGAGRDCAAAKHKNSPGCEWLVATWGFHT